MFSEITVILKDDSRTVRQKFGHYEEFICKPEDPIIQNFIEQTKLNFEGDPETIQVKIHLEIQ